MKLFKQKQSKGMRMKLFKQKQSKEELILKMALEKLIYSIGNKVVVSLFKHELEKDLLKVVDGMCDYIKELENEKSKLEIYREQINQIKL